MMDTLKKNLAELDKILENNKIVVFIGRLAERKFTVTFENIKTGEYFVKDFKVTSKTPYTNFNQHLRGLYYGR